MRAARDHVAALMARLAPVRPVLIDRNRAERGLAAEQSIRGKHCRGLGRCTLAIADVGVHRVGVVRAVAVSTRQLAVLTHERSGLDASRHRRRADGRIRPHGGYSAGTQKCDTCHTVHGAQGSKLLKGATIVGNGPDALTRVTMIGNDMKLDSGVGTCGKEGQSVPVGVGQPTLRIDGLTVGGTA